METITGTNWLILPVIEDTGDTSDPSVLHSAIPAGTSQLDVLHDTPGRLRVAVPAVLGSRARALACEDAVRAVPGVRHVQASELTGNLLVLYTPSAATRGAIQRRCAAWAGPLPAQRHEAGEPGSHRHRRHSGFVTAAMSELLPHVLPLVFGACTGCRLR